ncbi:MAG: HD domain-containing protein [Thermoprotei archaeon]
MNRKAKCEKVLAFAISAGRLKRVQRMGWAVRSLPRESVADHSYRTALLGAAISRMVDAEVDHSKVVEMALIHDLAEAFIGDWDHETTAIVGKGIKNQLENTVVRRLLLDLPKAVSERFLMLWEEYLSGRTIESKIVHLADKLEAAIQALEYRRCGMDKQTFEDFIKNLEELNLPKELEAVLNPFLEVLRHE